MFQTQNFFLTQNFLLTQKNFEIRIRIFDPNLFYPSFFSQRNLHIFFEQNDFETKNTQLSSQNFLRQKKTFIFLPWTNVFLGKKPPWKIVPWRNIPWRTVFLDYRPLDKCCRAVSSHSNLLPQKFLFPYLRVNDFSYQKKHLILNPVWLNHI